MARSRLHPQIVVVGADFNGGTAKWDGVEESYQSFGKKLLAAMFGVSTYGTSSALSLYVALEDMQGKEEYENRGGIQLAAHTGAGNKVYPRCRPLLFIEPARCSAAGRISLRP